MDGVEVLDAVWLLRPPGVYPPQDDTRLLVDAIHDTPFPSAANVLDIGTGTGVVAMAAARVGAASVTAIDVSLRAVLAARFNARVRGLPVRVRRGDLRHCLDGRSYDVVLANPPYVPSGHGRPAKHSGARRWDAGEDGRDLVDPLCAMASSLLAPGGLLLMVHSALCGTATTLRRLRSGGLKASVVARRQVPFGPVMRGRASWLEARQLVAPGQRHEELVVIRADRTE